MSLNRLTFALLALLGLFFSGCERHELSETGVLHQGHGGHDDHGYNEHGKEHGDHGDDHGEKKTDHSGDHGKKAGGKEKGDTDGEAESKGESESKGKGGKGGEPRDLGI